MLELEHWSAAHPPAAVAFAARLVWTVHGPVDPNFFTISWENRVFWTRKLTVPRSKNRTETQVADFCRSPTSLPTSLQLEPFTH